MTITTIRPADLAAKQQAGETLELLDVRTPIEFREVHADVAQNAPLDALDPNTVMNARNGSAQNPLYVICRSGTRGEMAVKKFQAAGYENVVNVEGGTDAWVAAGLPVQRGKKAMSLERQVRIAAGLIVLTGALLAHFVNPNFVFIPMFVGAGLTFAGITDTCAMGMLIAKMPWNQVSSPSCCQT